MPVYKTYFKILYKLRTSMLIYVILFLALTYGLTANTSVGSDQYEASKVKVMMINEDGESTLIDGFTKYLKQYAVLVAPGKDEEAIKDALFYGKAEYILTIPKGFSESFTKKEIVKLRKQTIPNSAAVMSFDTVVDNYFNMAKVYLKQVPNLNYDKLNDYVDKNLSNVTKTVFHEKVKEKVTYANEFNQFYFKFLGFIIIAAFITGISNIISIFNGLDIRRRHTATPLSYSKFNIQLILANLVFVIAFLIVFGVFGFMLNKSRIVTMNLILTWLNTFAFAVTALSISYLIGITVKSRKAIGAISTGLSLGFAFISGIFVPQEYLGSTLLRVASFTPTYWFVKANDIIVNVTSLHWNEVSGIFGCIAVEIGFTVALISIVLVVSKRKRQQAF